MLRRKVIICVFALLLVVSAGLVFPVPVTATYPPEVWVEFDTTGHTHDTSSVDEYDVGDTFIVEFRVDSNDVRGNIWSWQTGGVYYDNTILEAISIPYMMPTDADYVFYGKIVGSWRFATIEHSLGRVRYAGQSLSAPETDGVTGSNMLLTWVEFEVIGYGSCTLDLVSSPPDLFAGTKLNNKTGASIIPIENVVLTDGYFDNTGLQPPSYSPTAVITQKTPEPHYIGDVIELSAEDSLPGFDGSVATPITAWAWDIGDDGSNESTTETFFWNTTGYSPGSITVRLYVYAAPSGGAVLGYDPWNTTTTVKNVYAVRDIAITDVTLNPSTPEACSPPCGRLGVYKSWIVSINVTVMNNGTLSETFDVTAYYDSTLIGTENVTNLAPLESRNVTFTWDTTTLTPGNYVIKANATLVPGEINPSNNVYLVDVKLKIMGDVDGSGAVDSTDDGLMGLAWQTSVGEPLYNPNADFNYDGVIGSTDDETFGLNWGQIA